MQTQTIILSSSSFVLIVIIVIVVLLFTTNVFGNNPPATSSTTILATTPETSSATIPATVPETSDLPAIPNETIVEPALVCSGPDGAYTLNHIDSLLKESTLEECHGLVSLDGKSQLVMEETGKLVMYKNKEVVWSISATGGSPYKLTLDASGNLILSSSGVAKWSSETNDKGVSKVVLQNSGHLVFYKDTMEVVKTIPDLTTCVGPEASYIPRLSDLVPGQILNKCEALVSEDKNVFLAMQSDGFLKIYNATDKKEIWSTPGPNPGDPVAANLMMQEDGNAVVYNNTAPIWASNTSNRNVKMFKIQNDGNLVLYDHSDNPLWASNTRL